MKIPASAICNAFAATYFLAAAPAHAQEDRTTVGSARSAGDTSIAAGRYSDDNFGVAIAVYLGTHPTTPTRARIIEALTQDFRDAGLEDPVVFFFFQNDTEGSVASIFYGGSLEGPMGLGAARGAAARVTRSYNFRKQHCLFDFQTECP